MLKCKRLSSKEDFSILIVDRNESILNVACNYFFLSGLYLYSLEKEGSTDSSAFVFFNL